MSYHALRKKEKLERKRKETNINNSLGIPFTTTTTTTTTTSTLNKDNNNNSSSEFDLISDLDILNEVEEQELNYKERDGHRVRSTVRRVDKETRNSNSIRRSNYELNQNEIDSNMSRSSSNRSNRNNRYKTTFDLGDTNSDLEGDDEFEETDSIQTRGRGRTRKREENPALKKSLLEDALRSSLVTLLSLSTNYQAQSPALSFVSLTSLMSPSIHSPVSGLSRPLSRNNTFISVLTALGDLKEVEELEKKTEHEHEPREEVEIGELNEEYLEKEFQDWEEEETSSSESITQLDPSSSYESIISTSSSSDDIYLSSSNFQQSSNPFYTQSVPIASTSTSTSFTSKDNPFNSLPNSSTKKFSPTLSRVVGSSPEVSTNRSTRSSKRGGRRRSSESGKGRSLSLSPRPATDEQRRKAREELLIREDKNRMMTDVEDEKLIEDEGFKELVGAALNFINMSPRNTTTSPITTTTTHPSISILPIVVGKTTSISNSITSTPESLSTPSTSSLPLTDPLPIDLYSLTSGEISPKGEESTKESGENEEEGGRRNFFKGWKIFNLWWREKIFNFKEVKVWHLIGLGVMVVGVGIGIGSPIIQAVRQNLTSF